MFDAAMEYVRLKLHRIGNLQRMSQAASMLKLVIKGWVDFQNVEQVIFFPAEHGVDADCQDPCRTY